MLIKYARAAVFPRNEPFPC